MQLFPTLKLCRHRQRASTPTDLDPEQAIAALCTTLTCALPPLSVNFHLKTSFQPPWTEGKSPPLPGDGLQAGAGTDTAELSEHKSQPTHSPVFTNPLLFWPHSQIKLSRYIETNPKYWQLVKGLVLRTAMKYYFTAKICFSEQAAFHYQRRSYRRFRESL